MVPSEVAPPPPPPPVPDARASDSVYTEVDIYPTFPGGDAALRNFLSENTEYPDASKKKGTQGKVIVQFVVDAAGNVGRVKILRGVDPLIDEEAMRAVQKLPKFEPGLKEGKPVSVYYMVPLIFKLTK
jgi:protein TonB